MENSGTKKCNRLIHTFDKLLNEVRNKIILYFLQTLPNLRLNFSKTNHCRQQIVKIYGPKEHSKSIRLINTSLTKNICYIFRAFSIFAPESKL